MNRVFQSPKKRDYNKTLPLFHVMVGKKIDVLNVLSLYLTDPYNVLRVLLYFLEASSRPG